MSPANDDDISAALRGLLGPKFVKFDMSVVLMRMGSGYVGTASLAGVQFRGNSHPTAAAAARDLFMQLIQGNNLDAGLALDLASSGESAETMGEQLKAVTGALHTDGGSGRGTHVDEEAAPEEAPSDGTRWAKE